MDRALHIAGITGAREREQEHRRLALVERAQLVAYVRRAIDDEALSVIDVAAQLGITRSAVYKMLGESES